MTDEEMARESLGRLVRETWIAWASEQPQPKLSWLVPWEGLGEPDREVDRRIGEAVASHIRAETVEAARMAIYAYRDAQEADEDADTPELWVTGMTEAADVLKDALPTGYRAVREEHLAVLREAARDRMRDLQDAIGSRRDDRIPEIRAALEGTK